MVKTDDYMDNGLTTQTQKFEEHLLNEEIRKNENVHNHDWLTSPRRFLNISNKNCSSA